MKVLPYTIPAGVAAAFLATVLSFPVLQRRMVDLGMIITCFTTAFFTGTWSTECAEAARVDVGIVRKMDFADWDIDFTGTGSQALVIGSSGLAGTLISVPYFPWPVTKLSAHCFISDKGVDIASFDVPFAVATTKDTDQGTLVSRRFSQAQLTIHAGAEDAFASFIASLITQPEYHFAIKGYSDATLSTATPPAFPFGGAFPTSFDVRGVGFSGDVIFHGCNNFPSIKYERQINFTLNSTTGTCALMFEAIINNPSQLIMKLGSVSLNTFDNTVNQGRGIGATVIEDLRLVRGSVSLNTFDNTVNQGRGIGVTVIEDLRLVRGDNKVVMTTTSTDKEVCNKLLQTGDTFTLSGFEGTSSNPIVNKALLTLKTQVVIPKLQSVSSES